MDDPLIRITKNSQASTLGEYPSRRAEVPEGWAGLRMVRYQQPPVVTDRKVMGQHPVVSLLCQGEMDSHMRFGLHNVHTQLRANDLMLYSGGKEIDYAHWQARDATLISVEIDLARLHLLEPHDTRFAERQLAGQPRFVDPALGSLVRSLWHEGEAGCPKGQLYVDSLCLGLVTHVYRRFGLLKHDGGDAGARLSSCQLRRLDDYITRHLDQTIGMADLAQEVGLSRFHFTRVFSNTLGRSPYQHVIRKRLERGYQLLMGSDLPVADVALSAGFSSQAHFSALCRRELGATPRSLREQR